MVTKRKSAGVVTEGAAQAALRRAPARELSPEEDKVLRMRLGAAPARLAPLERAAEGLTDLEIELYAAEIEAFMKWKARHEPAAPAPARAPPSRTKEKIVRALRKL